MHMLGNANIQRPLALSAGAAASVLFVSCIWHMEGPLIKMTECYGVILS
jgi:hypothetical protein